MMEEEPTFKPAFTHWMTILGERFNRTFSSPTVQEYYRVFSNQLTTEQFVLACRYIFDSDADRFPAPRQLIETAKRLTPAPVYELPPETPKAPDEMSPEERDEYRKQLRLLVEKARASAQSAPRSQVMASAGTALMSPAADLATLIETRTEWLQDPVMRHEAIQWAMAQDAVDVVLDGDSGDVIGFQILEF